MAESIDQYQDVFNADNADMLDFLENPYDLQKKFKDFLKQKSSRHNSFEFGDEINFDQSESDQNNSECGSDVSFDNLNMTDMMQRHKAMRKSNKLYQDKNEELSRQIETMEEDFDKNRKMICRLEKELKCHQELSKNRDTFLTEFGKMQESLNKEEERVLVLEEDCRRMKHDEEDSIATIKSLRNQVDMLVCEVQSKSSITEEMQIDISFWKNKYTNLQEEYESCKNDYAEKLEYFEQVKEESEYYRICVERLSEEKKVLLNQYQDLQLEVSFCNKATTEGSNEQNFEQSGINLHSELTQALNVGNGIPNLRRSFLFDKFRTRNSESMNESFGPTTKLVEKSAQTVVEYFDKTVQTNEKICGMSELRKSRKKCIKIEGQLFTSKLENEAINYDIIDVQDKMKKMSNQLKSYECKYVEILRKIQNYEQEIICLNDINCKLCSGKMSEWLKEPSLLQVKDSWVKAENEYKNTLFIDALNLEGFPMIKNASGLRITSDRYNMKNFHEFLTKSSSILNMEGPSIINRIKTLSICKSSMQNIITQKIVSLKDVIYYALNGESNAITSTPSNFADDLNQKFSTLESVILRVSHFANMLGIAQCEQMIFDMVQLFKCGIRDLEIHNFNCDMEKGLINTAHVESIDTDAFDCESIDTDECETLTNIPHHDSENLEYFEMIEAFLPTRICEALEELGCYAQTKLRSFGKIRLLVILFIICGFLSYKRLDYKVDPVY